MVARVHQTEAGLWMACCAECGMLHTDEEATGYAAAERAAALHNSDLHLGAARPEWAEVARWAERHRAGAASGAGGNPAGNG